MRWDRLFEDLEARWAAEARRGVDLEVADRTRRARAEVDLLDRLAGQRETEVALALATGDRVRGRVGDLGDGWLLLIDPAARGVLVPLAAVVGIEGLATRSGVTGPAGRRFGLGYALRGLSRDRAVVAVTDRAGGTATGTIDAVGADAFDLSVHPPDEPRRAVNVRARRVVPFAALVAVRSVSPT